MDEKEEGLKLEERESLRSYRRHHRARLKKALRHHWGRDLSKNREALGKAVNTRTPCSCWMCGNPRRHLKQKTRQELSVNQRELKLEDWDL